MTTAKRAKTLECSYLYISLNIQELYTAVASLWMQHQNLKEKASR